MQESQQPSDLVSAERALAEANRCISNLLDQVEKGNDVPELTQRLAERRLEKRDRTETVERLRRACENRRPAPTEAWVDEQLARLGKVLSDDNPAAAHALHDLVGGQIVVTENPAARPESLLLARTFHDPHGRDRPDSNWCL